MLRLLLLIPGLLLAGNALAEPRFARLYKGQYGYTPSCDACHTDGGGTRLNSYGEQYKQGGSGLAGFAAVADLDADGDGASNGEEIAAKANPGHQRSTPQSPGDWLSTANLIPRAVQKLFPGITSYKPLDAILTEAEIQRAKALGATLDKDDETTIYVAVEDRKPVGTAVIVPARFEDKLFFVVLATDRQLTVTQAVAMHAGEVAAARDEALYAYAQGLPVNELPAVGDDESLAGAVQAAIKKAGTLLYVRLKKG